MKIRISTTAKNGLTHFKMKVGEIELRGNFSTTPAYQDDQRWYVLSGNALVASGYYNEGACEWNMMNSCVNHEDIKRLVLLQDLSCLEDLLWRDCSQLLLKWELAKKFGRLERVFTRYNRRDLP